MRYCNVKQILILCISLFLGNTITAQKLSSYEEMEVALRIIGHNILMSANDSTSRVLPIEKNEDWYTIRFENDFEFEPSQLVSSINKVFKEKELSNAYMATVTTCDSSKVVYSFVMENVQSYKVLHCGTRKEVKACYDVNIKIIEPDQPLAIIPGIQMENDSRLPSVSNKMNYFTTMLQFLAIIVLIGFGLYLWKMKNQKPNVVEDYKIPLGIFEFDTRNMFLVTKSQKTELTHKEAELLKSLHSYKNETVERDTLLQEVWGDEGDYIGRTLDVFISKLRKHLEADPNIKIVNIRGVGYKLVMS